MTKFNVGDIVCNFSYYGTGEVTDIRNGIAFVSWYEWSFTDCEINDEELELEPYGGF